MRGIEIEIRDYGEEVIDGEPYLTATTAKFTLVLRCSISETVNPTHLSIPISEMEKSTDKTRFVIASVGDVLSPKSGMCILENPFYCGDDDYYPDVQPDPPEPEFDPDEFGGGD